VLQPATPELAEVVPDLVHQTDPELLSHLFGGRREVFTRWVSALWSQPGNTFSYELATVAVCEGRLLGLELGHPGAEKTRLGRNTAERTKELLDEGSLASMAATRAQGIGFLSPYIPDDAYYLMFISVAEEGSGGGCWRTPSSGRAMPA